MPDNHEPEQIELSEWQLWLLGAGLLIWASLSIGLLAGLYCAPPP